MGLGLLAASVCYGTRGTEIMVKSLGCRFDTAEETACKGCYCEITGRFGGQIQDRGQGVVG
jgi:hypothetical protein